MSLVPYLITAVRSDDDGSGKNIVPFATVSILTEAGSPASVKSDRSGTNLGSTFTLDLNGQKQIWIEPGIYQISIANGPYLQAFISSATTENFTAEEKAKIGNIDAELSLKADKASVKDNLLSPSSSDIASTIAVSSAISSAFSGQTPRGAWNASTNSPALVSGVGAAGDFYEVSVAGSTSLNGESGWQVGDKVIFNGLAWSRIPVSAVVSVNGKQGAVVSEVAITSILPSLSPSIGDKVSTKGCLTIGDGGHGIFIAQIASGTPDGFSRVLAANGLHWVLQPVNGTVVPEQFGVFASESAASNGARFRLALRSGHNIGSPLRAYEFNFDGTEINLTNASLKIDLGNFPHVFRNFGGITADNLRHFTYNGRFSADNGYCKGLLRARDLLTATIDTIEITDVFVDTPTADTMFFALEYSSSIFGDNATVINIRNGVFKNIYQKTPDFPSAIPMTGFGNFGSGSTQSQPHQITFNNLRVENFYTVSPTDGTTVIGGDSDFFRLFTNPTQLKFGNLFLKNVGKRFIKTQEAVNCVVDNLDASLDSRFTPSNYNGTFEGQAANSNIPTNFLINYAKVSYPRAGALSPSFFNANGLAHSLKIVEADFTNLAFFCQSVNSPVEINSARGSGFSVNATSSDKIVFRDCTITNFLGISAVKTKIYDSTITLSADYAGASFAMATCDLYNVTLNWLTDKRIAILDNARNVRVTYTGGGAYARSFRPIAGGNVSVNGLRAVQTGGGAIDSLIESPGGSGSMTIRDYSSTLGLGFFSSGTWSFRLDNCTGTVTGAGVSGLLTATYA